jgi:hypothetical protein
MSTKQTEPNPTTAEPTTTDAGSDGGYVWSLLTPETFTGLVALMGQYKAEQSPEPFSVWCRGLVLTRRGHSADGWRPEEMADWQADRD